jgi:hypothetical protein
MAVVLDFKMGGSSLLLLCTFCSSRSRCPFDVPAIGWLAGILMNLGSNVISSGISVATIKIDL